MWGECRVMGLEYGGWGVFQDVRCCRGACGHGCECVTGVGCRAVRRATLCLIELDKYIPIGLHQDHRVLLPSVQFLFEQCRRQVAGIGDVGVEALCLLNDGDIQAVRLRLHVWRDRLPRALGAGDDGARARRVRLYRAVACFLLLPEAPSKSRL